MRRTKHRIMHNRAIRGLLESFPGSTIDDMINTRLRNGAQMGLLDDLNKNYVTWRPDLEADHPLGIEGLVADRQVYIHPTYGGYDVIDIDCPDGTSWRWAVIGTIATNEVGRRDPRAGDQIGVLYKGTEHNEKYDKDMQVYRVKTVPGANHAAMAIQPLAVSDAPSEQGTLALASEEPF